MKKASQGFTLLEVVMGLSIILIPVGVFSLDALVRFSSTGQGNHTGFITAIEQQGYFFRNYTVYVKTDNSSSQEDTYCLDRSKTDLADKIKLFSKNRELVSVSFEGVRGFGLGLCSGEQITDVSLDKK